MDDDLHVAKVVYTGWIMFQKVKKEKCKKVNLLGN